MITEMQEILEQDEMIGNTDVIEDDECSTIISEKMILIVEGEEAYIYLNVGLYPHIGSLIALAVKSICDHYFLMLYVADVFTFDKKKDEVVFGEDAKKYFENEISQQIDKEV